MFRLYIFIIRLYLSDCQAKCAMYVYYPVVASVHFCVFYVLLQKVSIFALASSNSNRSTDHCNDIELPTHCRSERDCCWNARD